MPHSERLPAPHPRLQALLASLGAQRHAIAPWFWAAVILAAVAFFFWLIWNPPV